MILISIRRVLLGCLLAAAASAQEVDHGAWQAVLDAYLKTEADGQHRFAFGSVDTAGQQLLSDYLTTLGRVDTSAMSSAAQKAYWLNAYNALATLVILENYPVRSIRELGFGNGEAKEGPWAAKRFSTATGGVSLNDIRQQIVRQQLADPMLHYGLACGAVGCPGLRPAPYLAASVDEALQDQAARFLGQPSGFKLSSSGLTASSIFRWYAEDFGRSEGAVLAHLRQVGGNEVSQAVNTMRAIKRYRFDWRLNEAK